MNYGGVNLRFKKFTLLMGLFILLILSMSSVNATDVVALNDDFYLSSSLENSNYNSSLSSFDDNLDNSINLGVNNTHIVTDDSYNDFFDNQGYLKSVVNENDTLIFNGILLNKGQIILNKKVNIIGDNAKVTNSTFYVNTDGCHIENLNIFNEYSSNLNCWGIKICGVNNISIIRCNISVRDKNTSYGIYIFDSKDNIIKNNNIYVSGDRLSYSIVGYEVYNSIIEFNNITSIGTGELHFYEGVVDIDGVHSIIECFRTYAILMAYSSNNKIYKNFVNVSSNINRSVLAYSESTNTIVAIDFYFDCHNNYIDSNIIRMDAKDPFVYGVGSLGSTTNGYSTAAWNNTFINNDILLNGSYMVTGIILGDESIKSLVKNNTVVLYSQNYTYGVTLELSGNATLLSNVIKEYGVNNYGMEVFSSDYNIIKDNYIYGGGEFAECLGLYDSNYNTIKNNTLISNGSYILPNYELINGNHSDNLIFGDYGSLSNWSNSLSNNEYEYVANFISSIKDSSDNEKDKVINNVSLSKLNDWINSLTSSDKESVLDWINNPFSISINDGGSPSTQNDVHADMVQLWNSPLWLDKSSNNYISDNNYYTNSPFQGMSSSSSINNIYKNNKYFNGYDSKHNVDVSDEKFDKDLEEFNSIVNGSSKLYSSSNDDVDGSTSVGDSQSNDPISGKAYELATSQKSMSPYAIPLVVLALIALFCYGFLRNDKDNYDN